METIQRVGDNEYNLAEEKPHPDDIKKQYIKDVKASEELYGVEKIEHTVHKTIKFVTDDDMEKYLCGDISNNIFCGDGFAFQHFGVSNNWDSVTCKKCIEDGRFKR